MKGRLRLVLCFVAAVTVSSADVQAAAGGDDLPVIDTSNAFTFGTLGQWVHFYGITLGEDWMGFPTTLVPDYNPTAWYEVLDETMPVYIDWEMTNVPVSCTCPSATPTSAYPARSLANEPWFQGHENEFYVGGVIQEDRIPPLDDTDYHTCAETDGVEVPQVFPFPQLAGFTADGKLRVHDIHGGIGNSTIMWFFRVIGDPFNPTEAYVLVIRWNRPQSYTDVVTGLKVDALPGTAVRRNHEFRIQGPCGYCRHEMTSSVITVQWPSSDIAGTSPRFVDASDLAHLASCMGDPVVWGFDHEGGPSARNFQCNVAPWGSSSLVIDSSDLSAWAADQGKTCGLSKTGIDEKTAILKWFGIVPTGEEVVVGPDGETVPGYDIVDWERARRAIADPYGYKVALQSAAEKASWTRMKKIYK